jgi:hypothetical protein
MNPESVLQVTQRSSGKPSRANATGQRLVAACQSPVLQRTPGKTTSPGPSTLDSIVIVRFCAFAPPGSPLDRYTLSVSTAESGLKRVALKGVMLDGGLS